MKNFFTWLWEEIVAPLLFVIVKMAITFWYVTILLVITVIILLYVF